MSRSIDQKFYHSPAWRNCRVGYLSKVGGLCERCLMRGIYSPAVIVHHKIHLKPENYNDPTIALAYSNLEALCRECHNEEHDADIKAGRQKRKSRYVIDENGTPHGK